MGRFGRDFAGECGAADGEFVAIVKGGADAAAGDGVEGGGGAEGEGLFARVGDDSLGEGVVGELFDAGGELEEVELAARGVGVGGDADDLEVAGA